MKKILSTILVLVTTLGILNPAAVLATTNTHSIDFEAGSSQSLCISDASQTGLDMGTDDFSMSVRVKIESDPSATSYTMMAKYNSLDVGVIGWTWDYNDNAGTKRLRAVMGPLNIVTAINQTLTTGTWYHIVYVYDDSDGTIDVYVDNSSIGQMTGQVSLTSLSGNASFCLGAIQPDNGNFMDGLEDEAFIYNKKLSTAEIDDLFNRDGNYCTLTTTDANLQGGWRLNNDGQIDQSGNNNTLTNNNSAAYSTDVPFASDNCGGGGGNGRKRVSEE